MSLTCWQESVKRLAGGIWKCKSKTCGRSRATQHTLAYSDVLRVCWVGLEHVSGLQLSP